MPKSGTHRKAILQTAIKLFREKGYASTGLNEILSESGAPKGSLYHYFPGGKEELGAEAVESAGGVVTQTLKALAAQSSSATTFIAAYTDLLSRWMEQSKFKSGCPISTTLLEMAPHSQPISRAGAAAMNDWIGVITGVYQDTKTGPGEARENAVAFIAAIEGALIIARSLNSTEPIKSVAARFSAAT